MFKSRAQLVAEGDWEAVAEYDREAERESREVLREEHPMIDISDPWEV